MSRRREVERRMHGLAEIREIMGSMKMLAFTETHKLAARLAAERRAVGAIERTAGEFLAFHPALRPGAADLVSAWVVVGAERGLCGDFDARVIEHLEARLAERGEPHAAIVAVGRRLCARLADDPRVTAAIPGPDAAEEVEHVLVALVDRVGELRARLGPLSLTAVFHRRERGEVDDVPLLPAFHDLSPAPRRHADAPLLNLDPEAFVLGLADEYLPAALHEILDASLMAESQRRVQHLDGAVRHLDDRIEELGRAANQLRQEEIIEEIEVILLAAADLGEATRGAPPAA